jgi:predicted acyl esterase
MRRRPAHRSVLAVMAASLLTAGLMAVPGQAAAQAAISLPRFDVPTTSTTQLIKVRDGVVLNATITKPILGTWPVVIVPGTFAGDFVSSGGIASKLAGRGYITVSYTERGFGNSTGLIDTGGPEDVADVSDVLDWTLANTPADPNRVGLASISYGAGFLPMVALRDKRFKAMAMVSGWGDMWRARFPNDTSALVSNIALYGLSLRTGKPSPEADTFFRNAITGVQTDAMRRYAAVRSPITYVSQLKSNPLPLYMSTSMNELIWPDDQTIDFFNAYPGTKHIDVMPGDHATVELTQPIGIPGITWASAFDWLDKYVAGNSSVPDSWAPVRVAPRGPQGTNILESQFFSKWPFESYPNIAAATGSMRRQYLATGTSGPFGMFTNRALSSAAGTEKTTIREGENLLLQGGVPMYQGGWEGVFGTPTTVPLDLVDQGVTGIFAGAPLAAEVKLRGAARAHLELTPSAATGSVFVYLLERAPNNGSTYVIGHKPYSWSGAVPGRPMSLDIDLDYNAYDVPAGHRIITAVSTGDVLYADKNPASSTQQIGPGSYIDLPVR